MAEIFKKFDLDSSLPDSSYVGKLVRFVADNTVGLAVIAGSEVGVLAGFTSGSPNQGNVLLLSTAAQVRAGMTLVAGDRITTDGNGRAISGGYFGVVTQGATINNLAIVAIGALPVASVVLASPSDDDGKPIFSPDGFPLDALIQVAGCADTPGSPDTRGTGAAFALAQTGVGTNTLDTQFVDSVYFAGGHLRWDNATAAGGDYFTLEIVAPATAVTANGSNTGNANLTGALITPASGNGAYDVNLANAIPVPAYNPATKLFTGYYDWSDPVTGKGTVTVSGSPGAAKWNLVNAELILSRFLSKFQIAGAGFVDVVNPHARPKKVLPHWKTRGSLHGATALNTVLAWWALTCARAKTAD